MNPIIDDFYQRVYLKGTSNTEIKMVAEYQKGMDFAHVEEALRLARLEFSYVGDRMRCMEENLSQVIDLNPKRLREYMTRMENPNPQ